MERFVHRAPAAGSMPPGAPLEVRVSVDSLRGQRYVAQVRSIGLNGCESAPSIAGFSPPLLPRPKDSPMTPQTLPRLLRSPGQHQQFAASPPTGPPAAISGSGKVVESAEMEGQGAFIVLD